MVQRCDLSLDSVDGTLFLNPNPLPTPNMAYGASFPEEKQSRAVSTAQRVVVHTSLQVCWGSTEPGHPAVSSGSLAKAADSG